MRVPRLLTLAFALWVAACEPRAVGVLTLAPVGMRASAGCEVAADGASLSMPRGAWALAATYAPAGEVVVALGGRSLAAEGVEVRLYFDGNLVGTARFGQHVLASAEEMPTFKVRVDRAGPHTWELEVVGPSSPSGSPAFEFQKLVVRVS